MNDTGTAAKSISALEGFVNRVNNEAERAEIAIARLIAVTQRIGGSWPEPAEPSSDKLSGSSHLDKLNMALDSVQRFNNSFNDIVKKLENLA